MVNRSRRKRISIAPRDLELSYDELRARWRHGLSDDLVRSMAADYLRGYQDECNADAYKEYQRRFGGPSKPTIRKRQSERRTAR